MEGALYQQVRMDRPVTFPGAVYQNLEHVPFFSNPPKNLLEKIRRMGKKIGNDHHIARETFQVILNAKEAIYKCSYLCFCLRENEPVSYVADSKLHFDENSVQLVQDTNTLSEIASHYFKRLNPKSAMRCSVALNFQFRNNVF